MTFRIIHYVPALPGVRFLSGVCQPFVSAKTWLSILERLNLNQQKDHVRCGMLKRNQSIIIIIILLGLLLMAIVTWLFDKRIRRIEEKKSSVVSVVGLPAREITLNCQNIAMQEF